jgi:hypothetical protein
MQSMFARLTRGRLIAIAAAGLLASLAVLIAEAARAGAVGVAQQNVTTITLHLGA